MTIILSKEYHAEVDEWNVDQDPYKYEPIDFIPDDFDMSYFLQYVGNVVMDWMPSCIAPLSALLHYLSPMDEEELHRYINEASAEGLIIVTDDPIPTVQFGYCYNPTGEPRRRRNLAT